MQSLKEVLQAYQINPAEIIPITNRLFKVQSHPYSFALKRSSILQANSISRWRNVYQLANSHQLDTIVPVYLTKQGEIYHSNQQIYYLSPWIEQRSTDEPEHGTESFFQAIGKIHQKTKQQYELSPDETGVIVMQEKERAISARQLLLKYVELFEQRHFMSPFELQVCTHYRDIEHAFSQLDNWYDYYLEDVAREKQGHTTLCHGNLRSSHIICNNNGSYLINWERARIGNPVTDLATFFYYESQFHDSEIADYINTFPFYEKNNPLLQSERSLLAIYLLDPQPYLRVIEYYYTKQQKAAHPFQVRSLERAYRRLMKGLSLQSYLYKKREETIEQQTESD